RKSSAANAASRCERMKCSISRVTHWKAWWRRGQCRGRNPILKQEAERAFQTLQLASTQHQNVLQTWSVQTRSKRDPNAIQTRSKRDPNAIQASQTRLKCASKAMPVGDRLSSSMTRQLHGDKRMAGSAHHNQNFSGSRPAFEPPKAATRR